MQKNISLVRIDDRLIHGQVTTAWLRVYPADEIIISNEKIANDPIYKAIFSVAQIPGKEILLLSPDDTVERINAMKPGCKYLIITPTPVDIVTLIDKGLQIDKINIGGLQNRPGTTRLAKVVYAKDDEIAAFKALQTRGVEMEVQMVPTEKITKLNL
ncbi:MAG TPA: PTS sugar transporter subunit IIB [Anaerolineaceae bacterium]|jgi:mannose/fructose/N-acetylgalactosamine-specific phosphotransferase system component IIB|nr:PTS sugar transporter subunit IIB [Anaerolineaceae bacterium]